MRDKIAKLTIVSIIGLMAFGGLAYALLGEQAQATTSFPGYDIILEAQDAPSPGRPAPYGQWVVTHNNKAISETLDYGTVARTAGYDIDKVIFCDLTGSYALTGTLFARTLSTGETYTITAEIIFPGDTRTYTTCTYVAPWMSLALKTGVVTATTATCGIYVQTP